MKKQQFMVSGRSADGAVYYDACGHVHSAQHALRFDTQAEAERHAGLWRFQQRHIQDDLEWVYQIRVVVAPRKRFGFWRKEKRWSRKDAVCYQYSPIEAAFDQGHNNPWRRNPYPPGKRHNAFEQGQQHAHDGLSGPDMRGYGTPALGGQL